MAEIGLTSARWPVLGAIAASPVALPVAHLARNMGLSRQAVQRPANEMDAEGLLAFEDNPHHERAKLVRMTERGRSVFDSAIKRQRPWAGALALLLTLARLAWWWRFDRKPEPAAGLPTWQTRAARVVHALLLVVVLGMAASGIGMMVLSGAGPIVFGAGALPDFHAYPPRVPHGLGARLMIGLLLLHVGAALHHHLVRRDGSLRRMWFGATPSGARRP